MSVPAGRGAAHPARAGRGPHVTARGPQTPAPVWDGQGCAGWGQAGGLRGAAELGGPVWWRVAAVSLPGAGGLGLRAQTPWLPAAGGPPVPRSSHTALWQFPGMLGSLALCGCSEPPVVAGSCVLLL